MKCNENKLSIDYARTCAETLKIHSCNESQRDALFLIFIW